MIIAIIAGGSGSRLWPLSTPTVPKHLLSVVGEKTLLRMAYERAKKLTDDVFVVTAGDHADLVREQLPELPEDAFIVEPARRNTGGCFIAALHHAQSRYDPDNPIGIIWADHYIRDVSGFVDCFQVAGRASQKYNLPVLVGIEPTYPTTGLGYIHKAELLEGEQIVHRAAGFKEKPDLITAQSFFKSGEYLWNAGYLVGTLNAFTQAMQKDCTELWQDYQKLLATQNAEQYKEVYLGLENVQIDYRFHEKVKELLVVSGTFDWLDVGNFNDLYDASEADEQGNAIKGKVLTDETANSYLRNDEAKPVAVIGLDNVVVVNTPHGILVARKDLAQKVREVSKRFQEEA